MPGPLTNPKHEKFAQALAKGKSQGDAYAFAGYKPSDSNASTLRRNQKVVDRISELQTKAANRAEVTVARVLRELSLIGFANMEDYIRIVGGEPVVDLSNMTRDQAAAISEVTIEDFMSGRGDDAREVRRIKFKMSDKRSALVDIGKHLGMFKDVVDHQSSDGSMTPAKTLVEFYGKGKIGQP